MKKNIIIVGGGSAGWMVAGYLSIFKQYDIRLIESPAIPIIGVGESTIASMIDFLTEIGITEDDLFNYCGAIRKYGIKHHNWNGKGEVWHHRFCYSEEEEEQQDEYMKYNTNPVEKHRYGYHLDATKLGILIKDKVAIPNGVTYIIDEIKDVVVEDNKIKNVLGNHETYIADIYIDCTGFKSLLRDKLGSTYKYNDALINNCAVCGPGVYLESEQPLRYTQTYSMDYGWRWRVSLQHRTGNGYAFNKDLISIEDAKKELIAKTPGIQVDKIFVVHMKNRYNTVPWKSNVISIGLSCGFLEPLEASGLFLIYGPLKIFQNLIDDPKGPAKFNRIWNKIYKHTSDFIAYNFKTSSLNHTEYWRKIPKTDIIVHSETSLVNKIWVNYNYRQLAQARGLPLVSNE
jgi:tryptophan halogenase